MKWTSDLRKNTDWEEWFAWCPVPLETACTGAFIVYETKKVDMVWWETIERRKLPKPNGQFVYIYREKSSTWDIKENNERPKTKKPKST